MTTDQGLAIAQLLMTAAKPLIERALAVHPDPAAAATTLHDLIAAAVAGPGLLTAAEAKDDAVADNALDDKFKDVKAP